jgi:hypothetical protein
MKLATFLKKRRTSLEDNVIGLDHVNFLKNKIKVFVFIDYPLDEIGHFFEKW